MNLVAATITVYFVGVVNFQSVPTTGTPTSFNVIVPLAKTGDHRAKTLMSHRADIVITGLEGECTKCATLEGIWNTKTLTCTVEDLSEKTIKLTAKPAGATLNAGTFTLPKLKSLCAGWSGTGLNSAYTYAAKLTIDHGTIKSCPYNGAWISFLTLDKSGATVDIEIGGKVVQVKDKGKVTLRNAPTLPDGETPDEEAHFWWYYAMYNGTSTCDKVPNPAVTACTPDILPIRHVHGDFDGASGIGCSNSSYP